MNFKQTLTMISIVIYGTLSAQTPLIDEEFDALTSIPVGWIGSSVGIETSNACAGSSQSVFFNGESDYLITPILIDPSELKFLYLRSSNTAAWTLNVDYSTSTTGSWTNLGSINNATNAECLSFTADLSTLSNIYIRFVDARTSGAAERYIDNVIVTQREVLGVSLSDFKAISNNNSIKLEWSTSNEKDNSYFDVERSFDGKVYLKIGQVKGNGSTSEIQNYSFVDDKNVKNTAYYRLKQVDFNGKAAFSKVISVNSNFRKIKIKVYPTLVNNWVNVDLNAANDVELIVSDVLSRVISTKKVKKNIHNPDASETEAGSSQILDLSGVPKGMYFISIKSDLGIETFKIQKL